MSGALPRPPVEAVRPVELHGDLTIQVAAERKFELIGLVDGCVPGSPCLLEVSQVVDVDSAGVQLLIALRRSLAERDSSLELVGVRGALQQALASYHLDPRLGAVDPGAARSRSPSPPAGAHA